MLDWLAVWGVTQAVGFVFKPILEDLAKDAAKDWAGDIFKNSVKNVLHLPKKEPLEIAAGKALKEFLELFQQELQDADLDETAVKEYLTPLKRFLKNDTVKTSLGAAFQAECVTLDTRALATAWNTPYTTPMRSEFDAEPTALNLKTLPPDFDWERVAKRYLRKARAIRQENDELRKLLDSQALQSMADAQQAQAGIAPDFDLRKYRETLQETYGILKLDSIEASGYAYNELKLWRMFIPQHVRECRDYLPQLYDLPKDVQDRLKAEGKLDELPDEDLSRFRATYREQPMRPILEMMNAPEPLLLVILGDPGSGKSSLLQYLALDWAEKPLNELPLYPLPLLIELRRYIRYRSHDNRASVLDFLHAGSAAICHLDQRHLDEWLKAGKALVMFDGLDEVFDPAVREEVITEIIRFTNDYHNARVIVTSRMIGYKPQRLRDAGFCHLMLQELDDAQIDDFITRWHDRTYANDAERALKAERLRKAINNAQPISQLAGNPLLLTLMAILNRHQELPRDRTELYHQASRVLLHQWDVEGKLLTDPRMEKISIDYRDKQAMLRKVAFHMQASEKGLSGNTIRADELEKILSDYLKSIEIADSRSVARIMIEQLRARNFILCLLGENYYAFVHRTFLEYFCASEFVWQFKETRAMSLEQLKTDVFGKRWNDERWHEVLRLIAGMIESNFTGEIIDYLCERDGASELFKNIFLAADLLGEVRNRQAIKASDDRLLECLKTVLETYTDDWRVNLKAGGNIARNWREVPDTLPYLKTLIDTHDNSESRQVATVVIGENFKDIPETLLYLRTLIMTHDDPEVRRVAVLMLGENFKDDPETLLYLKALVDTHEKPEVRRAAVSTIGVNFYDAPDTLLYLKTLIDAHEKPEVRRAAVSPIGWRFKDAPDTLPYLKTLIDTHEKPEVRRAAVSAIGSHFKDAPNTLPYLKTLLDTQREALIRLSAAWSMVSFWQKEIGMADLIFAHILQDSFEHQDTDLRQEALKWLINSLIEAYSNDPRTAEFLRRRAEQDPDERVRNHAQEQLTKLEQQQASPAV